MFPSFLFIGIGGGALLNSLQPDVWMTLTGLSHHPDIWGAPISNVQDKSK